MTAGRRSGVAKKIMLYPLNAQWKSMLCQEPEVVLEQKKRVREPRHWAEHEFGTLRVHDQRLTDRLCQVAQSFYNQPQANIPQAAGSHAAAVATYRLLRNDKISMDDILLPHLEATMERIREHPGCFGTSGHLDPQLQPSSGYRGFGANQRFSGYSDWPIVA